MRLDSRDFPGTLEQAIMKRWIPLLLSLPLLVALAESTRGEGPLPDYRAVPGWRKLPSEIKLGQVSAVATDSADRVYVFHRGQRPVLVFDRNGTFLRSWG